jgi:putative lipoic acid-binding regulatory protein
MPADLSNAKLDLPYPCRWIYKVIGEDEDALKSAAHEVVHMREHWITLSRRSAERNYCCLNVEVLVYDEEDRVTIYETLRKQPAIALVL